jgi:hypothetical protein
MATWPAIEKPSQQLWSEYYRKDQVKTEFEDGSVQSRAQHTSGKWFFKMGWYGMTNTNYGLLQAFFDANIGDTFTYTHPFKLTSHTCRFSSGVLPEAKIAGTRDGAAAWALDGLSIEEA